MKFSLSSLLLPLALSSVPVLCQNIAIGVPADLTSVHAGSKLNVEVDRPDTLSGSTEVAVVIGVNSCGSTSCPPPADILGTLLYNGPYNPQFAPDSPPFKPPHQNFTVTIPSNFPKGRALLAVYHIALIGAGRAPFNEIKNVTLNIL